MQLSFLFAALVNVGPQGEVTSPSAALDRIRALRSWGSIPRDEEAVIRLAPGRYVLHEALRLSSEDSNIRFEGAASGRTEFSGGVELARFRPCPDGIWRVPVPADMRIDQLWVGGARAQRAVSPNGSVEYHHIRYNLAESNACLIAESDAPLLRHLSALSEGELTNVAVHVYYAWDTEWLRPNRADPGSGLLGFTAKAGRDFFLWKKWLPRFKVENFRAALDAPGEWYHDRDNGELLYIPRAGEDPATAVPFVPVTARLVEIAGGDREETLVRNVTFSRIAFSGQAWRMPDSFFPHQAAKNIGAAIEVSNARAVSFDRCSFERTSTYAVAFGGNCRDSGVTDSLFTDLGAGAVRIGTFKRTTDVPADRFTGAITVDNNIIVGGGRLFPEAVGVQIAYAADCRVTHNEIADLYYTGISIGWGWNYTPTQNRNNLIAYNHIHDLGKGVLCDMGGIYNLSEAWGTRIEGNVIHHVRSYLYTGSGGTGIYMDEASSGVSIVSNLVYDTRSGAAHQHYGKDNVFANNIFAYVLDGCSVVTRVRKEPHRSFSFRNNIVAWNAGCDAIKVGLTKKGIDFGGNVYWSASGKGAPVFDGLDFEAWMKDGGDMGSIFADPRFRDPANGDFSVAPDSPALSVGFVPWDISKAGVRGEVWRQRAKSFAMVPDVEIPEPERYRGLPRWRCGFDDAPIGSAPKFPLRKSKGPIAVVADATAKGGQALRIADSKATPGFDPYVYCTIPYAERRLVFAYSVKYAEDADFVQEWREHKQKCRNGEYATGMWIRANARSFVVSGSAEDGSGGYAGKDFTLSSARVGQWLRCKIEMRFRPGERARCVVTLENESGETSTTGEFFALDEFDRPNWTAFFAWGGHDTDYLLDEMEYSAE